MKGKIHSGQIGSFVTLALGIFFLINAMTMNIGSLSKPGTGLWPLCLSIVIITASIISFLTSEKEKRDEETVFAKKTQYAILGAVSLFVFIMLFERWGLTLSSFLLLFFWMRVIGNEKWRSSIVAASGFTIFSIAVFVWGIHAPFPDDPLLIFIRGE